MFKYIAYTLKLVSGSILAYLSYCALRGFVWGVKNPNPTPEQLGDFAQNVARFKA